MSGVPTCSACPETAVAQWRKRDGADPAGTLPVFGCAVHAIDMDLAACVHEATCTAPDPELLPGCGCTPEAPVRDFAVPDTITLPTGWTIPASAAGASAGRQLFSSVEQLPGGSRA